jgi:signal peptide peptidase SppA
MNVLEILTSQVWALQPETLKMMQAIANRETSLIEALQARDGKPLDNTRVVSVRDGVAVVPINGVIMRRANLFSQISGATSTEMFAKDITMALENPNVQSILLTFDSPGGQASGINELAEMIRAANTIKPVKAYVSGAAASAAYWLASAASEIVVDKTAVLGSIGVVLSITKTKDADGEATYEIYSTQSPKKKTDPESEDGQADLQKIADDMAAVFVEAVAQNRNVTTDFVLSNYGQGGVMVGRAAVKAGLADRLGSFEGLLAEMQTGKKQSSGGKKMADEKDDVKAETDVGAKVEAKPGIEIDAVAELKAKLEASEKEKAEVKALLDNQAKSIEKLEADARQVRLKELAAEFGGGEKDVTFLTSLATAFGEDSQQVKDYVTDKKATKAQLEAAGFFKEIGSESDSGNQSAAAQLEAMAKKLQADDPKLSYAAAYAQVMNTNPALYDQYKAESRKGVN